MVTAITIDAYDSWSNEQLKRRCRELCRALDKWQRIAGIIKTEGFDVLPKDWQADVDRLIEAYKD